MISSSLKSFGNISGVYLCVYGLVCVLVQVRTNDHPGGGATKCEHKLATRKNVFILFEQVKY